MNQWTFKLSPIFRQTVCSFRNFVSNFISGSQLKRDPLLFFFFRFLEDWLWSFRGNSPFSDTAIWENRPWRDLWTPSTGLSIAMLGEGETGLFLDNGGAPQHENINKTGIFWVPKTSTWQWSSLDFFDTSKPFFPLPMQQKHHWWFGVLLDLNMRQPGPGPKTRNPIRKSETLYQQKGNCLFSDPKYPQMPQQQRAKVEQRRKQAGRTDVLGAQIWMVGDWPWGSQRKKEVSTCFNQSKVFESQLFRSEMAGSHGFIKKILECNTKTMDLDRYCRFFASKIGGNQAWKLFSFKIGGNQAWKLLSL